ncbi:MAG: hypothetical protein HRU12_23880, partial [Phaeodactylibacter sp.]|nr:hypothetical protein [Phaeodactylibacter sp.]
RAATHGLGVYETDLRELVSTEAPLMASNQLFQPFPNPARDAITQSFELGQPAEICIQVFEPNGQLAATLLAGRYPAGKHQVTADVSGLAAGYYALVFDGKAAGQLISGKTRSLIIAR